MSVEDFVTKTLPALGAALAFMWGVYQFTVNQREQAETRRIEATKPFLEKQLVLYTEATRLASTIATATDPKVKNEATASFWRLYWGELSLLEDALVESAMVNFGRALDRQAQPDELKNLALKLAHTCRDSLSRSWRVKEWQSPHWWEPTASGPRG